MKKLLNWINTYFYEIVLIAFIGWVTLEAIFSVGNIPENCGNPYSWWLPISIFGMLTLPAICGYLIGRKHKDMAQ